MGELTVDRVSVAFDRMLAVDDVSLTASGAEVVAVLGPSGCGKSTLLRAIAGIEPISAGRVLFDGVDQRAIPVHRRGFGLMFQDGQLFDHMSVGANVAYGPRRHGLRKAKSAARVDELLDLVGLAGYADRAPATLSGGQRQRVALARALAPRPGLLLLDEPLSALDAALRVRLASDVRRVLRQTETLALLVTHDHDEAFAVADRVVLMRDGRFVQSGTPREVWAQPVDDEAALFLGYSKVVRGADLRPLQQAFGIDNRTRAFRVNALQVLDAEATGPSLSARVVACGPAVDESRLVVVLDSGLEFDAVAPIDAAVAVGDAVRLGLTIGRTAALSR